VSPSASGGRRVHPGPQRTRITDPTDFPLHNSLFLWTAGKDHHRLVGPLASRRRAVSEGHAPVVAVLRRCSQAHERMVGPKGRGSWTLCSSFLQISRFLGVRNGGHVAVKWTPAAVMVGEGEWPVAEPAD
jgi:hypothetical protein